MSARGPHICPSCGERVSAFAAGCALCGAPLDPRRAVRPPSLAQRMAPSLAQRMAPSVARRLRGAWRSLRLRRWDRPRPS